MDLQGDFFAAPALAGFRLVDNAVSPAEEATIAQRIDAAPLKPFQFGQWQGKRLTASYGSAYDFTRHTVLPAPPFPAWLDDLRDRLGTLAGIEPQRIAQALLIRYDPGAGIGWHRDRPQYGDVVGLSLCAPATLRLRQRIEGGFRRHKIHLPPRSLYRLSGDARWEWEHSIAPMAVTRRSVTLRTMR